MPLPPGLTLDTLAMLCRMSDSDLTKLKLPATLLSAIRVWRSKVGPAGLSGSPIPHGSAPALPLVTAPPPAGLSSTQLGQSSRDVPTIVATSGPTQERTWGARQQTVGAAMSMAGVHRPPGRGGVTAVAGPPVVGQGTAGPVIDLTGDTPTSLAPQPMMINPQQGFPPRSLHAFVPHGSMAAMAGSGGIRLPGSGGANSRLVKAFPLSMSTPLHKVRESQLICNSVCYLLPDIPTAPSLHSRTLHCPLHRSYDPSPTEAGSAESGEREI